VPCRSPPLTGVSAWTVLSGRLRVATLVVVFAMIERGGVSRDRTWGDEATPQV
jgi:hypothetical protein